MSWQKPLRRASPEEEEEEEEEGGEENVAHVLTKAVMKGFL